MVNAALRLATSVDVAAEVVAGCLDLSEAGDLHFAKAWTKTLAALPRHERGGALAGVTGHVAESVVEILLADLGYRPVWHFTGPGRHGVDLVMLSPETDFVVAVEVKGTLRAGCVPRMSRRAMLQMSAAWIDKTDNPGMAEWGLQSADVYGGVVAVNLADMTVRTAVSADFATWRPVRSLEELAEIVKV